LKRLSMAHHTRKVFSTHLARSKEGVENLQHCSSGHRLSPKRSNYLRPTPISDEIFCCFLTMSQAIPAAREHCRFHVRLRAFSVPTFFHCFQVCCKHLVPSRSFDRFRSPLPRGPRQPRRALVLPTIFTGSQRCRKHSSRQLSRPSSQHEPVEAKRGAQRHTEHSPFQLFPLIPKSVARISTNSTFRSFRGPAFR